MQRISARGGLSCMWAICLTTSYSRFRDSSRKTMRCRSWGRTEQRHDEACQGCCTQELRAAEDCLHKSKLFSVLAWSPSSSLVIPPSFGAMDSWWLLDEGESVFFKVMTPGKTTLSSGWPHTQKYMNNTN